MPDWRELAEELARAGELSPRPDGPKVAEKFELQYGRVELIETIRRALHGDEARPGKAHLALVRLPFETIYTTNYDSLVEQACASRYLPYRSVVSERQLPFHGGHGYITVVKMHGDLTHEEQIVVTTRDYREYEKHHLLISTYLSGLLVTKTPLLIGYSAKDPDLLHILEVIDRRLGNFRRMGYSVRVQERPIRPRSRTDQHFRVVIVELDSNETPDDGLASFFESVSRGVDAISLQLKADSHPDYLEAPELVVASAAGEPGIYPKILSKLSVICYVSMVPSRASIELFREVLEPVITENGMTALKSEDLPESENPLESVRSTILLSKICVLVWNRPSSDVQYDLSVAIDAQRPIVFLALNELDIPELAQGQHLIRYSKGEAEELRFKFNKSILEILFDQNIVEAEEQIRKGESRTAILSVSVALEARLRATLASKSPHARDDKSRPPYGLGQLISAARQAELFDQETHRTLDRLVEIRNHAAHSNIPTTIQEASTFLSLARRIFQELSTP